MSKDNPKLHLAIAASLIAMAVVLRIMPHPANFAPVAAVAIFGGAVLPRRLAIWTPVAAMVLSDLVIGFYDTIFITWACYVLIALAASQWLRKRTFTRGISLTLGGSVFFFLVTNFATWVWSGMYSHTWSGLAQCYTLALPFFRNTALSDLVYTAALFSLYFIAVNASNKLLSRTPA